MIKVFTGLPGSGKSLMTAKVSLDLLHENEMWYKKSGIKRLVYSNLKFAQHVEEAYPGSVRYWEDPRQLVKLRDCDVIMDEIATYLDATQWANMSLEFKRWLQQHRKFGIRIYGNTQDFAQIDISMRRLVSDLIWLTKVAGSRDPSPTTPPVKKVWGLVVKRELDPQAYSEDKKEAKGKLSFSFLLITKRLVSVFDTRQEIKSGEYPAMRHIERMCERENCAFHKVVHA